MTGNPYRTILIVLFAVTGSLAVILWIAGTVASNGSGGLFADPTAGLAQFAAAQMLAGFAGLSLLLWLAVGAIRWQAPPEQN